MPKLLSGQEIRDAIETGAFIIDGDPSSAEAVKYDFHMGSRVLKAAYRQPKEIESIPEERRSVDPGEVVYVLTRERLRLPRDMIATLMPKRKLAHKGIHILGGLGVDPEYRGVLVVGLYNFSSTPFPLLPGMKLIAATFQRLSSDELSDYTPAQTREITDFPEELITLIQSYKPSDAAGLQALLDETRRELSQLKNDLTTDREWRQEFQSNLDKQNSLIERTNTEIGRVLDLIKEEASERKQHDLGLSERLNAMSGIFGGMKVGWIIAALLIGAALSYFTPRILGAITQRTHSGSSAVMPNSNIASPTPTRTAKPG